MKHTLSKVPPLEQKQLGKSSLSYLDLTLSLSAIVDLSLFWWRQGNDLTIAVRCHSKPSASHSIIVYVIEIRSYCLSSPTEVPDKRYGVHEDGWLQDFGPTLLVPL